MLEVAPEDPLPSSTDTPESRQPSTDSSSMAGGTSYVEIDQELPKKSDKSVS